MKLTCYIIDDEPLAIEVLEAYLQKIDRIEIAGTFQNALKAFEALQEKPVDLLFLDIQMPGLTGITFLETLKHPPKVIFTTAYREYALEGFELDVTDYLLKPISFERFLKAINKLFVPQQYSAVPLYSEKRSSDSVPDEPLYLQAGNRKVRINLNEILFIESQRDYVKIKTLEKEISALQTIKNMEDKLPSDRFLRIHRSFIINMEKIESWSTTEIELPGMEIPIGRTYKNAALKVLEERSEIL